MRAYLAGPDVFFPDAVAIGRAKQEICDRSGIEGIYPLDADFSPWEGTQDPSELGYGMFQAMIDLMDGCDLIIANMTPFRGPSMDVGTAIEVGYMHGRGKPVSGVGDRAAHNRQTMERTLAQLAAAAESSAGSA